MIKANENNSVCVCGIVHEDAEFDHRLYGEAFYSVKLYVARLSGVGDVLPVTIPNRVCPRMPEVGEQIRIYGQLRSYNKRSENGNRLVITLFARAVEAADGEPHQNEVELTGFLCKPVMFRTTPFMREISDILLAVNRSYNKSDYLPCIAWGRNAHFAKDIPVGARLHVQGRLQSRIYQKALDDGAITERTAYEVSCSCIETL